MKKASIEGKVVVITGASSGAGRAMALAFAERGASLVLASRNREALNALLRECQDLGARGSTVPTDTRHAEQQGALAETARSTFGHVDVWINNAGVLAAGALEDIPADVNEAVIRTNLLGYVHGAQAVLPIFKHQGYGILVNNISVGGWLPTPYMAAYCASKFGLKGFSEALRGELATYKDIHICDLFPAFLDSPGMQHAANYTGRVLRPSPPLYDPRELARSVIALVEHPRNRKAPGLFPHLLHAAYSLFPAITRRITGGLIRSYLAKAEPIVQTSGNVLGTVGYGNSIHGGWRSVGLQPKPQTKAVMAMAGIAAGLLLLKKMG
jgi:short-subunit dehydrogenase